MWFFLLKAIGASIIGDASATWFKKNKSSHLVLF